MHSVGRATLVHRPRQGDNQQATYPQPFPHSPLPRHSNEGRQEHDEGLPVRRSLPACRHRHSPSRVSSLRDRPISRQRASGRGQSTYESRLRDSLTSRLRASLVTAFSTLHTAVHVIGKRLTRADEKGGKNEGGACVGKASRDTRRFQPADTAVPRCLNCSTSKDKLQYQRGGTRAVLAFADYQTDITSTKQQVPSARTRCCGIAP